jgi:hypothetical protein
MSRRTKTLAFVGMLSGFSLTAAAYNLGFDVWPPMATLSDGSSARLAEITQSKGDSETDPTVSPDEEFANFERWDKTNIMGSKDDKPEDQPFNYLRPSQSRGLRYEARIGVNPFKLGFVAAPMHIPG